MGPVVAGLTGTDITAAPDFLVVQVPGDRQESLPGVLGIMGGSSPSVRVVAAVEAVLGFVVAAVPRPEGL